jgi:tRNA(fMet)-specific endonuclease VapC
MYFLDTNICIYYLRGLYKSIEEHFELIPSNEIKIPVIVKAELIYGIEKSKLRERNKNIYKKFVEAFEIVNLDDEALSQYSKIRLNLEKAGIIIGSNDLFIASIVLANNGILVTHNTKEFERISELHIEDWTK